jgi:hypothetical protein
MNNLILAVISISFAAVIMLAGINYSNASATVRAKLVNNNLAEIQQMITDYQNLKISLGRSPTGADFQTVYAGGASTGSSANSTYNFMSDGHNILATKVSAMPYVAPTGTFTNKGWTYLPASETGFANDMFCLKITNTGSSAEVEYEAAKLTAQKEMLNKYMSEISFSPNGCAGVLNVDPSIWPAKAPTTYYLTFGDFGS